ncbi:hypothetical protein JCM21900_000567 [Sporobolomyces salmonicolor]
MLHLPRLFLSALVVVALQGVNLTAAASTAVSTANAQQAASLQAAAIHLQPGSYTFENVETKQKLYYVPKGNNIYPYKKGTAASVTKYSNAKVPWHRFEFGDKNKCLSSAWGGSGNNAAVMYVCASGAGAQKTTLEKTKQWWLFVPVSKTAASAPSSSYANTQLIAAQSESVATRNKKIAAQKAVFHKRGFTGIEHARMAQRHKKRVLERRTTTVTGGTFYIIPTDHLIDSPARALTGQAIKSRGIVSTQITTWKKGNKAQQWKVTRT